MKISEENIRAVLSSNSKKGMTVKEIISALNQKKKRKARVKKILRKLGKMSLCQKTNNRYRLTGQIDNTSKGKRSQINQEPLGIVLFKGRSTVIHSYSDQVDYPLARDSPESLFPGDIVTFTVRQEKSARLVAFPKMLARRNLKRIKGRLASEKNGRRYFIPCDSTLFKKTELSPDTHHDSLNKSDLWLELNTTGWRNRARSSQIKRESVKKLLNRILLENDIQTHFPDAALKESEKFQRPVRMSKNDNRKDLRRHNFITIDGADAKDFDDSIFAIQEGDGFRLWVSIADVAEYVKIGSQMDREARYRATSTYLPGNVYPMLPENISNNLCSLKAGVNRKTITCEIVIDHSANPLSVRLYESINRIARRLSYKEVDHYFETGKIRTAKSFPELAEKLDLYGKIAELLENKRRKRGTIDFSLPETQFRFNQKGEVTAVRKTYQTKAQRLIEQFMLEANEAVGTFCVKNKIPILWRNHQPPPTRKKRELKQLLWNNNINIPTLISGVDFNSALTQIKARKENGFLELNMLRSMSLATYEVTRKYHFGLAATTYCHFTSPIRRYPDLLVHRALKRYFNGEEPLPMTERDATNASERERKSAMAERSATKLTKTNFISTRLGSLFNVRVSAIHPSGIHVEIETPFIEGFLPLTSVVDDFYLYTSPFHPLIGKRTKRRIFIGTELQVILTELDWKNLTPVFCWISWKR